MNSTGPASPGTVFTIGYGGREPKEFVARLVGHDVRTVADVRLRPDRASMGAYVLAQSPEKGIQRLLGDAGIDYVHLIELGNLFLGESFDRDWPQRYELLLSTTGELLLERLFKLVDQPDAAVCLLCAEKNPTDCHRRLIAGQLAQRGYRVVDL